MSETAAPTESIAAASCKPGFKWWIAAFAGLFVLALFLDIPVSTWVHDHHISSTLKNHQRITRSIRLPGNFLFTVIGCAALLLRDMRRHFRRWPQLGGDATILFIAGVLSGVNWILKWCFGRIRPFHDSPPFSLHPFRGGWSGLWLSEQNLSFPSGDVSIAFASAACLAMIVPSYRWLWWTLAIIVILERIAEGAHYPSDTVAAAALGIAVAHLARNIVQRMIRSAQPGTTIHD